MNVDGRVSRLAWGVLAALGLGLTAASGQLWVLSASAIQASVPATEGAPGDFLRFLDGSSIHGAFKGMDTERGLRWQHPDAKNAFDLQPTHFDFLRFTEVKSVAMSPTCHFRFASGDDLYGSLVSLDREQVEFNTWFGGTMKIPRSALQTITFLPKKYSIVYEGPSDPSTWTISGGQQMQFRMRGGGMIGGGFAASNPGNPPYWAYHDGSFTSTGVGTLARDFKLSGSSTIEFDLACSGAFNLLLNLYSPTLERVDFNSSSFLLELDSGSVTLRRNGRFSVPNDLGNVLLPSFDKGGKGRITVHCNKEERTVTVLLDGAVVKRWTEVGGFDDAGGGVLFQNQSGFGAVTLSNFRISQWEGKYEPDMAPATTATNGDLVSFINHDQAGGKIDGVTEGKLNVDVGGRALHVPVERVRQIDFMRSSAAPEPRGEWEVRAVFPGGGAVSFQLDKWDEKSVSGRSALFGAVAFQPGSIREVEFNLNRPRTEAAPSQENEFDDLP